MRSGSQTRSIAGSVRSDGTIWHGTGFIVRKGTAGVYTIIFPKEFRLTGITASPAAASVNLAPYPDHDRITATVYTYNAAWAFTDGAFNFTATGEVGPT